MWPDVSLYHSLSLLSLRRHRRWCTMWTPCGIVLRLLLVSSAQHLLRGYVIVHYYLPRTELRVNAVRRLSVLWTVRGTLLGNHLSYGLRSGRSFVVVVVHAFVLHVRNMDGRSLRYRAHFCVGSHLTKKTVVAATLVDYWSAQSDGSYKKYKKMYEKQQALVKLRRTVMPITNQW